MNGSSTPPMEGRRSPNPRSNRNSTISNRNSIISNNRNSTISNRNSMPHLDPSPMLRSYSTPGGISDDFLEDMEPRLLFLQLLKRVHRRAARVRAHPIVYAGETRKTRTSRVKATRHPGDVVRARRNLQQRGICRLEVPVLLVETAMQGR